jgi:3-hydroxyisobutyrate dehydrogenase-like beta-hydroxyacid dehydrogenase
MALQTVGIISPGDMGQAIGAVLIRNGLRVVAALDGRSERTRRLAAAAGIEDGGSIEALVASADLVLSVLVPAAALEAAGQVAEAMRSLGKSLLYADWNAIAPETARAIAARIEAAGGRCMDGGIIGPPPRASGRTRIYVSGSYRKEVEALRSFGLDIRFVGPEIGQASGLKICYGALTKGLAAIGAELLIAAHRLGLAEALRTELEGSQKQLLDGLARSLVSMPTKAHRWVGEMEEVAATFRCVGLPPHPYGGIAELYRLIAETPTGRETPEEFDRSRSLSDVITALSRELPHSSR